MSNHTVDHVDAIGMFVNDSRTFDTNQKKWLVIHKTAGGFNAENIANYFATTPLMTSSHYVVGQNGDIVQCVPESRGAAANCCLEAGHADYLPTGVNLNLWTISIEIVDSATDNSSDLTIAQMDASFSLIKDVCSRNNIPMVPGSASGGIIGHADIAPQSRTHCPGNFPWSNLWEYLKGDNNMTVPSGWHDDGQTLVANNHSVRYGFRDWILNHNWDPGNVPITDEYHLDQVQFHGNFGPGQVQIFRDNLLWYTAEKGAVQEPFLGLELEACYHAIAALQDQVLSLQTKVAQLSKDDITNGLRSFANLLKSVSN